MRRTRLCELLDIELPVLGAPMGPEIASLELAAAVSNAGGLGMISFNGSEGFAASPLALSESMFSYKARISRFPKRHSSMFASRSGSRFCRFSGAIPHRTSRRRTRLASKFVIK